MLELINPLMDWLTENVVLLVAAVLSTLVVGYFLIRAMVVLADRWANNQGKLYGGTRQFKKPSTWFALQPKHLHDAKEKLLASPAIREFYAPVDLHKEEREENRVYFRNAWLSPYSKAARASVAQNKAAIKGKHLPVRRQIADAAQHISVRPLPYNVRVAGDPNEHFEVELKLNRRKRSEVYALLENIVSAVEADSVDPNEKGRTTSSESFIVHMTKPENILTKETIKAEFFDEHPAERWNAFPMALDEMGDVWSLPITHSIIFGMTGSGKGSPIQATVRQAIPFVKKGEAMLFGSDLKESELLPYAFSNLYEEIAFDAENSIEIIDMLYSLLKERNKRKRAYMNFGGNGTKANLQRRIPATKETPMMIFIIDELLTLLLELHGMKERGKAAMANLAKVMALGRSLGIYVIAATQVADKELLGRMRDNFVNAIVLRNQASVHMNELFLGEGAVTLGGFDPRKIEQSTDKNDYKTSGMGYVVGETGDPLMVRFAYMDDDDIAKLVRENPNPQMMASLQSGELERIIDERDDDNELDISDTISRLSKSDRNDFLDALEVFNLSDREDDGVFVIEELDN